MRERAGRVAIAAGPKLEFLSKGLLSKELLTQGSRIRAADLRRSSSGRTLANNLIDSAEIASLAGSSYKNNSLELLFSAPRADGLKFRVWTNKFHESYLQDDHKWREWPFLRALFATWVTRSEVQINFDGRLDEESLGLKPFEYARLMKCGNCLTTFQSHTLSPPGKKFLLKSF